jgi:hypothetical protein
LDARDDRIRDDGESSKLLLRERHGLSGIDAL